MALDKNNKELKVGDLVAHSKSTRDNVVYVSYVYAISEKADKIKLSKDNKYVDTGWRESFRVIKLIELPSVTLMLLDMAKNILGKSPEEIDSLKEMLKSNDPEAVDLSLLIVNGK